MIVYYAHCKSIYDTPQEQRDVALLESLGFDVVNPNDPEWRVQYVGAWVAQGLSGAEIMDKFVEYITASCHAVAFRALPDGRIPAGVYKEVMGARAEGMPILELPRALLTRGLGLEETREYLHEVGQR
jgi:hypothetical protein